MGSPRISRDGNRVSELLAGAETADLNLSIWHLAAKCLVSAGAPFSLARPKKLAAAANNGQYSDTAEWMGWRVEVNINEASSSGSIVCLLFDREYSRWVLQDPPGGAPSLIIVEKGVDPTGCGGKYHYVRRTAHYTMGECWDPSPSIPAEVSWRNDGTVSWIRHYVDGCPADRGEATPALQSFWRNGCPKMFRTAASHLRTEDDKAPSRYAEFYPDGRLAVEVSQSGVFRAYFPDGQHHQVSPRSLRIKECQAILESATPVNFDASMLSPYSVFLDKFPGGSWRVHKCLHPKPSGDRLFPPPSMTWTPPTQPLPTSFRENHPPRRAQFQVRAQVGMLNAPLYLS